MVAMPDKPEEAGTPDIIGAIRAGLAIELKEEMGVDLIESREHILIFAL